jgi:hypothetical protein
METFSMDINLENMSAFSILSLVFMDIGAAKYTR